MEGRSETQRTLRPQSLRLSVSSAALPRQFSAWFNAFLRGCSDLSTSLRLNPCPVTVHESADSLIRLTIPRTPTPNLRRCGSSLDTDPPFLPWKSGPAPRPLRNQRMFLDRGSGSGDAVRDRGGDGFGGGPDNFDLLERVGHGTSSLPENVVWLGCDPAIRTRGDGFASVKRRRKNATGPARCPRIEGLSIVAL